MSDTTTEQHRGPAAMVVDMVDNPSEEGVEKKTLGWGFWVSSAWILLVIALAVLAPILPLKSPTENFTPVAETREELLEIGKAPFSPSGEHWFGTDQDARDLLSRTIWGARISLVVGFSAIAFGMLVGGSLGMIAGFLRGPFDAVVSFAFLVLLSFPGLVLALLITALVDRSLFTIALTLGILSVAPVGRLARAQTLVFSEREFVMAAETIGASKARIILREILPNVVIPMSALALLGMAVAIVAEAGLAFLGLSVESGITWGVLIQTGSAVSDLESAPWIAFIPIAALFLTVAALNFAGDRLRDYLDIREISL